MTEVECQERIKDLRELRRLYQVLYFDRNSIFYNCISMKSCISKANEELLRLEELRHNHELEDSYDQNTGEYHESIWKG